MASMERVVGSLAGVSHISFDTIYDLLFTTERVIAVIIRPPIDVLYRAGIAQLLLGDWLVKRNDQLERNRIADERRSAAQEKSPDELLSSHRFNFEIRYDVVTSAEVTRGLLHSSLNFHLAGPSTVTRKISFTLTKDKIPNALHLLSLVLPSKIKGK